MHVLNFRAQDKAAMQLSELEEEMDQRIQAAEHKTRKDVSLWDWPFLSAIPDGSPFTDRAPGRVFHGAISGSGFGGRAKGERDNK